MKFTNATAMLKRKGDNWTASSVHSIPSDNHPTSSSLTNKFNENVGIMLFLSCLLRHMHFFLLKTLILKVSILRV